MALTYRDCLFDDGARDFSAVVTRHSRSRPIVRKTQRRLVYRRMGVLALAVAVPAMAAPPVQSPREHVQVRFALADVPEYQVARAMEAETESRAETEPFAGPIEAIAPAEDRPVQRPALQAGPAAKSFAISGDLTDRARAQRCMTMAIYYEAASESVSGQRAVAQVVMNRMSHPNYPNNICGVVFQGSDRSTGCQFSFTCDGSLARRPQPQAWQRAERVARAALGGFVYEGVGLATHYHTLAVNPYWARSLQPAGQVGAHLFYRWRGAAGRPAAFDAAYRGSEILPARSYARAAYASVATGSSASANMETQATAAAVSAPSENQPPLISRAISRSSARSSDLPVERIAEQPSEAAQMPGTPLRQYQRTGQWLRQP